MIMLRKMSDDEFEFFREIIYNETGIKLSEHKRALLESRVIRRMRILKVDDYSLYRKFLSANYSSELTEFINVVTTNKTEFFREKQHFSFMLTHALPQLQDEEEVRIWSAGCSTGEEAYSIAITACEFFGSRAGTTVKILATDIDTQVLHKGQTGLYSPDVVKIIAPHIREKYFVKTESGYQTSDALKSMISFRRLNLMDNYPMKKKFKIIFCRNVVIYFDKDTQRELFKKIYDFLDDDGYLFIGHSENLSGVNSDFKNLGHTIYSKIINRTQ